MWGNSTPMSGRMWKVLPCIEAGSTSQTTPSTIVVGHPGHWKTLELVSRNYLWPGLSRYIAKFIAECNACNQTKTFPTQKVGKLIPNKVPDQCWQVISVDMIRELPDSKGYNAVLVV